MAETILVDTGPLVALLNRRERQHVWTRERLGEFPGPLLTCEPVLAEAAFLLQRSDPGNCALMTLVERQAVRVAFHLDEHLASVTRLMAKYANIPMSLADACLVRMTEVFERSLVVTFDRDFRIYRRHGRQAIPVLSP